MEASKDQNPNKTEFQSVDDDIDTHLSPATHQSEITPAEIDRKSDSSTVTSSAVNVADIAECGINDGPKQNDPSDKTKKKKKKKKKKTNPGFSDTSSDTINENVQDDHSPAMSTSTELLLIQKAEVDRDGSFQESTGAVSTSPFQEGEREDIQEGSLSGKKKKKKKKKKKASETDDFDVSVLSSCDVLSSPPSNDRVPSQALSSDTAVPEAGEIKSNATEDHRNPRTSDETVSELTSDQQELLLTISTASGQNEIGCQESSITPEYNVQGDSSGKPKKKKKRKKKQKVEYNILSDSESGVVLATGITEIERVNLLQVMPEKSSVAGAMQQQSQTRNDAEAMTTQADTQLLCVHDVSATSHLNPGEAVELIKPDEDSSCTGQSLREE